MRRRLTRTFLGVAVLGSWLPTTASALTCVETVAAKFTQFAEVRMKAMQRCRERVLTGHVTACPDHHTAAKLHRAESEMRRAISETCGGSDGACGIGGDDNDLAVVGWNIGECPNLHGGNCHNSIGHCGDVADCLVCLGDTAIDQAMALAFDSLAPAPPDSPVAEIHRCQRTIGRSMARYFRSAADTLLFCEQRRLAGYDVGPCPDPLRAAPRIAKAREALVERICDSCGASDGICGGDDLTPEWIGFPASCPAVTLPGGASCARPINNLGDIVACVGCVTDYQVQCLDPLSVPTLQSYPTECSP